MKLIQAMKALKDLNEKAADFRSKVQLNHANVTIETNPYPDPKKQVSEWIQGHSDLLKEILRLRVAITRTNLATLVPIELGGVQVRKTIAEWIHRRRDLSQLEMAMWQALNDRGLKEQNMQAGAGAPVIEVRVVRHYDPVERDTKVDLFRSEPSKIDAALEVVNAVTDLIE